MLTTHTRVDEESATHSIPTRISVHTRDAIEAGTTVLGKKKQRCRHNRNRYCEYGTTKGIVSMSDDS